MPRHWKDRYRSYTEPWGPVRYGIWAVYTGAKQAIHEGRYRALLSISALLDAGFYIWFKVLNENFIRFETNRTTIPKLVPQCTGTVLELGPGTGNQLCRFDKSKVTRIVGVESNPHFVPEIQAQIEENHLSEIYDLVIASCDDVAALERVGIVPGSVDTVLSIQVLCSVPDPKATMRMLYGLLKPGGKFIFWEHHRNSDWVTRVMQHFWNPMWRPLVGGCSLTRDMKEVVLSAGEWVDGGKIEGDEQVWSMLPRVWGSLVKPE
ncbi:methyltransferase type 11 [Immersiella caudata]|uniref:Methyltransferase type 11 n=1 Tax=Immersiella caudata TaxID=314043 RepID=A0AA39WDA8_9PEZI|nr:methyltransferase type 11 [Immersiella caudata]